MPYVTRLPESFLTVDADLGIIDTGDTRVLNATNPSEEFALYDPPGNSATIVERGDSLRLDDAAPSVSGTYAGSGTISTTALDVDLDAGVDLTSLSLQLNPVDGHFLVGEDGSTYFISETPFDGNNLSVTLSGTLLGLPLAEVTVPLSQLDTILPAGPVLAAVNNTLNTAVLNVDYDPAGQLPLDAEDIFCFAAGTLILTDRGEVPVQSLSVGARVMTRDNGLQEIRWIGSCAVTAAGLARNPRLRPIRIRAGALGAGKPSSDLLVSPQHRILVRSKIAQRMFGTDEILVAARQLLPLDGIEIAEDMGGVEYVHILFDRHEIVLSNGAETESLYTGPEALKAVGPAAQEEIFTLFPELRDHDCAWLPARPLVPGRVARRFAGRHAAKGRPLVM